LDAILILPAVTFGTSFEDATDEFPMSLSSTADRRDGLQEMTQFQSAKATSALPTCKMANEKAP